MTSKRDLPSVLAKLTLAAIDNNQIVDSVEFDTTQFQCFFQGSVDAPNMVNGNGQDGAISNPQPIVSIFCDPLPTKERDLAATPAANVAARDVQTTLVVGFEGVAGSYNVTVSLGLGANLTSKK